MTHAQAIDFAKTLIAALVVAVVTFGGLEYLARNGWLGD